MKVVHICPTYTVELSYQENYLVKYHNKICDEVSVITSKWVYNSNGVLELTNEDIIDDCGVKIIRLAIKNNKPYSYKFRKFSRFYDVLSSENPNVIFLHGCQWVYDIDVVKYMKEHNDVVLYVDNHADYSNSATNFISKNILHKIIWKHYTNKLIPYTKRFYGVLPSRVNILTELYKIPNDMCELLLMGADDELVKLNENATAKGKLRSSLGLTDEDFVLITGGKIDMAKTQTLSLMRYINSRNDNVKLIVFGSVVDELKEKFDSLLSDKIKFIGWLKSDETYKYISIANLAVFPGRHSVIWEQTVAQGVPMVVKYWDGTTHVDIGGNVKFLQNDSYEEIENVLNEIIDNKDNIFDNMKKISLSDKKNDFLYSKISKKSIRDVIED